MRCYNLKAASAISDCLLRDGPIPCALAIRTNVSTPSGIISVSTTPQRRRRSLGPRPAPRKRPRADLDRAGYGREEERSETAAQHGQAVQHSVKDYAWSR